MKHRIAKGYEMMTIETNRPECKFELRVLKSDLGFLGTVNVYENNRRLWKEVTNTRYLYRQDALLAANKLAEDIADKNGIQLAGQPCIIQTAEVKQFFADCRANVAKRKQNNEVQS